MVLLALVLAAAPGPGPLLAAVPGAHSVLPHLLLYLLPLVLLNVSLSPSPHESLLLLARWSFVALLGLGLVLIARRASKDRFIGGVPASGPHALAACGALLGAVISGVALWQGVFGFARQAERLAASDLPLRDSAIARLSSGRVFGPLLLPASLGGALAITLPISLVLCLKARGRARLLVGGALALQGAAFVWTFSLGAWGALAAATLAVVVAAPRGALPAGALPGAAAPRGGEPGDAAAGGAPVRRRPWILAGIGAAAALAAGTAARLALLPVPGIEDRPLAYRAGNWLVATRIVRDHPLFGTGLGAFGSAFPGYRTAGVNESRFAHSSWLQLLAELGVGALPLLLLAAWGAFAIARRGARGQGLERAGAIGALAFLIHNAVDFTFYQPSVTALFALAVALATAGAATRENPGPAPALHRGRAPDRALARALVLAVAAGAALVLVTSGLSSLALERALRAHGVDPAAERAALASAARIAPLDPDPRTALARALAGSTEPIERAGARRAAEAACRLDALTPYRWWDLARAELEDGRPGLAWTHVARAARLYPLKTEYAEAEGALRARLFDAAEGRTE